jgi:hypothetical protein
MSAFFTENLSDVDYVIGDHYDDTVNSSLVDVAERLSRDLVDVQGDGMIADDAEFEVRAEESGPQNVVRVTLSGLPTPHAPAGLAAEVIRNTIRVVCELASHYNRAERARPDRCRFILAVDVVSEGGATIGGVIATMHHQNW